MNSAPMIHPRIKKAYTVLDGKPLEKADALAATLAFCEDALRA